MNRERSTTKRLIASFIAFTCIILTVGIISLVSINQTTQSLKQELGQAIQFDEILLDQTQRAVEKDTLISSIIVATGSLSLILFNFLMTVGGIRFTRKEKEIRDRFETEMRTSNEKLSSVIEGTDVGTWVWDITTGRIEINARWAEILGCTLDELTPFTFQTFQDLLHPDDLLLVNSKIQEVLTGKLSFYDVEFRMHHKNGDWRWIVGRGKITKWSDAGEPRIMSGTQADITSSKEAKAALEKSENSHRKLIEQMNQGLLVCKVTNDTEYQMIDAIVISMNRRVEEILQKKTKEILGNSVNSIFYGNNTEWIALFSSVVKTGQPKTIERYSPYLGKYLRISAYAPEPLVFAAIIDDISDSKQIQDQLAHEKARLETTLLSVGDGVIALSRAGSIEVMNSVAQSLIKWDLLQAIGKSYHEVVDFGNEDIIKQAIESKHSVEASANAILTSKLGEQIPVEAIASPIYDSSNDIDGVVLVFRDCTEKRQKQQTILDLSYSDAMTGLKNRRAFENESYRLNHVRYCPLVLVIADVNNLKLTNDAFGHDAGDMLLKTVADILKRSCRETDIVARIGGDEFVLLLPNTDALHADIIIDRINTSIAKAKVKDMPISVSIGKAIKLVQADDMDVIFREAEHEMYRKKVAERPQIRKRIIDQLLQSLFNQNPEEKYHCERVSDLCRIIAEHAGLSDDEVDEIGLAGTMHDIGKIALGTHLVENDNLFEELEGGNVLRHPEVGYNILSAAPQYGAIAEFVLTHHERWDGTGYPSGLQGNAIPIQGRILALADSFSLMTMAKPHGFGLSEQKAIERIRDESGTKYDPQLVELFSQLILNKIVILQ